MKTMYKVDNHKLGRLDSNPFARMKLNGIYRSNMVVGEKKGDKTIDAVRVSNNMKLAM